MQTDFPRKRKASDETRKKQSEAKQGNKHNMFGRVVTEDTRNKLSDALTKNIIRYDFDMVTPLPHYMKTLNDANDTGYLIVSHPSLSRACRVKFSSKRVLVNDDIMTLLRAKCVFYLEHLNRCMATGGEPIDKAVFMKDFNETRQ